MQIIIDAELVNGKIAEWGLIEFQGSFSKTENDDKSPNEVYIGDLNFIKDGTPFFLNGHHIIYGQEVKLSKPFVILHKNFENENCEKQYLVKAVIRKKIIFKSRPKPIIPNEVPINNH